MIINLKFKIISISKIIILIFSISIFVECARFRINELKSSLVFSIAVSLPSDKGLNKDSLLLSKNDHVIHGLPIQSMLWKDRIIITDYNKKVIKLYKLDKKNPEAVIGKDSNLNNYSSDIIKKKVNFQFSGLINVSQKKNIFCFVIFPQTVDKGKPGYPVGSPPERPVITGTKINFNKSGIICLNDDLQQPADMNYLNTIGNELTAIQNIFISESAIGILHNNLVNKKWQKNLSVYFANESPIDYNIGNLKLLKNTQFNNQHIEIEEMVLSPNDNRIYIYVSIHDKKNFELISKTLFRIENPDDAPEILYQTDDPADFFACPLHNGGFYIKNTNEEGDRILFKIFDASGEYIRNVRITLPGIRASWFETFCTNDANIYSNRLYRGQYELYEWK